MPANNVNLNIQTNWSNGFASVAGSLGNIFYYNYTGGNMAGGGGNGNNAFDVGSGNKTFTVSFVGNDGVTYKFAGSNQAFLNKNNSPDLSGTNTDDTVTIADTCATAGAWNYGIRVEVKSTGETFDCDPVITNRA
jgi:hypothetical protein